MNKIKRISVLLLLLLTSCVSVNLSGEPSATEETIIEMPEASEESTISPLLTEEILRNSEFLSPVQNVPIQLANGEFKGTVNGIELTAVLQPGVQFGDLNADGLDDAAMVLAENTGGSGSFYSLVVIFSREGKYQQAPGLLIDDRPIINSLSINNGKVTADVVVHGPNDPMANPTQGEIQEYSLVGENLFLTRLNSALPGGGERSITIDSPIQGEEVSGSVRITGSMPVGPFENNLVLKIYDENKNELLASSFMVQTEDVGKPATFDNAVPLPAMTSGTTVVLMLEELSMADGSPLSINSVVLRVK